MKPSTIVSLIIGAGLIIFALMFASGSSTSNGTAAPSANNVSMEHGQQIIEISAKGGYSPQTSYAKAGVPSTLRIRTRGTFDCSSFVVIPSIGFRDSLPQTGEKDVAIPSQKAGDTLQGFCGMGMSNFKIQFN